ncbi:radical SAM protein [Couchioplanes caeruleus]|uniref:Radical SAM core domain-containing protein n=2 Tax=Couchioplanes caeruleus TaxID=56438 RepID=A0A1K0FDL9_9ACTN|nr:radical SAM protein [Couchioplanes caeruleus]OJF10840.1 hypothetical protein BG844_29625 [Couchioplanes caeruleus subsp. caeruleus]ROP32826.1 uncharacterized protein EDD30_5775 [Couchioplanes caeruleus]
MPGIDTYIIKTVSWCNLNCSYCYYYNGADTSFMNRPKYMDRSVVEAAIPKMIDHCLRRGVDNIEITFHGGEPLLQPKEDCRWMMEQFDRVDQAGIRTLRKMQTNGVMFDDGWGELLSQWRTRLGFSIDGPKIAHDRFRVDHAGKGSYDRAVRGLQKALTWADKGLQVGVVSVVDPTLSGDVAYKHLRELGVGNLNFLLPEGNYAHPPYEFTFDNPETPYGRFFAEIFDAWVAENNDEVRIRYFVEIMKGMLGQAPSTDQVGNAPVQVAVIETDGSIEPTDNFKSCTDRLTDLGLSIFHNSFDDLYEHEFFQYCTDTSSILPNECQACPFLDSCGAGRISTRYSEEDGFSRKTIYCADLLYLYRHVQNTLVENGHL